MRRGIALALLVMGGWAQAAGAQLSGVVRSAVSGEGLKSAVVTVLMHGTASRRGSVTTGPDGSFMVPGLAPGQYQVFIRKSGYHDLQDSRVVEISADTQSPSMALSLWPLGVVTGRVYDWDGQAVADAEVRAYALVYGAGGLSVSLAARGSSNDSGEYRLFNLPAGKVLIQASPPRSNTPAAIFYAQTPAAYYPGVLNPSQALPVELGYGTEMAQIDVRLRQAAGYAIKGTARDASEDDTCMRCVIDAVQRDGPFQVPLPQVAKATRDGVFVLKGLAPGDYTLIARDGSSDGAVGQAPVTLREGNLENAEVVVGALQSFAGEVVVEGRRDGLDPASWIVRLAPASSPPWWPSPESEVGSDRRFRFDGVTAGRYRLVLRGLPAGAYLKAIQSGGQPLPSLEMSVEATFPISGIQALVAFDGASVSGTVRVSSAKDSAPAGGARVIEVPRPNQSAPALAPIATESAPGGSFRFSAVPPGSYALYALPAASALQILDPAVQLALERYAAELKLEANQTAAVDLVVAPQNR
jgi:hypothetical protein